MSDLFISISLCTAVVLFVAFLIVVATLDDRENRRLGNIWKLVMEGEYDYVVYGEYDYVRRVGSMPKHSVTYTMKTTAFHFADGRACVVKQRLDMPFPTGTQIRVLKNGLGDYRVEQVETA
jgi:hypothetical protein